MNKKMRKNITATIQYKKGEDTMKMTNIELEMLISVDAAFNAGTLKDVCENKNKRIYEEDYDPWLADWDDLDELLNFEDSMCSSDKYEENLKRKAKRADRRRNTKKVCSRRSKLDLSMTMKPDEAQTEEGKKAAEEKTNYYSQAGRYESMASMEKPNRWHTLEQMWKHGMAPSRYRAEEAAKAAIKEHYQTEEEWVRLCRNFSPWYDEDWQEYDKYNYDLKLNEMIEDEEDDFWYDDWSSGCFDNNFDDSFEEYDENDRLSLFSVAYSMFSENGAWICLCMLVSGLSEDDAIWNAKKQLTERGENFKISKATKVDTVDGYEVILKVA